MTIITQPFADKKLKKQKDPLVEDTISASSDDIESNRNAPLIVTWKRSKAKRISSLTTICVFLTALLVFTTGIIGGFYLYRQFTQYRLQHFRGWASVPYVNPLPQNLRFESSEISSKHDKVEDILSNGADKLPLNKLFESIKNGNYRPPLENYFDEEFDIDIEYERYERIEVPDFSHGRRGRFIHDFSENKTGIIDLDEGRCFVMPLNRSVILPPLSLFDLVKKMRSGFYELDTEIVRQSFRVLTPAISDYKSVGYYIARDCADFPTYQLEKVSSPVFKRSVDAYKNKMIFSEFAGNKIMETQILNIRIAPGKK